MFYLVFFVRSIFVCLFVLTYIPPATKQRKKNTNNEKKSKVYINHLTKQTQTVKEDGTIIYICFLIYRLSSDANKKRKTGESENVCVRQQARERD